MDDDTSGPWAIRNIETSVRDAAVAASKRARMTVGEWLSDAIMAHVARERQALEEPGLSGEVMAPGTELVASGAAHNGAVGLEALETALGMVERLAKLRADGKPPQRIVSAIQRRLYDAVKHVV